MLDALRGVGARVVTVSARFEDGYRIDLDAFRDKLSARTRLVMFASPQNPSGVSITHGEIGEMLDAMSRHCPEAILLVDETYREATYGSTPAASTFAGLSGRVLTCASLSKAYGAPGLRIGWLTVPDRVCASNFGWRSSTPRSAAGFSTSSSPPGCYHGRISCSDPGAR